MAEYVVHMQGKHTAALAHPQQISMALVAMTSPTAPLLVATATLCVLLGSRASAANAAVSIGPLLVLQSQSSHHW